MQLYHSEPTCRLYLAAADPAGYRVELGCTTTLKGSCTSCWGRCCGDSNGGDCPTSSCHANELGDVVRRGGDDGGSRAPLA
jgi:hypothetical protein